MGDLTARSRECRLRCSGFGSPGASGIISSDDKLWSSMDTPILLAKTGSSLTVIIVRIGGWCAFSRDRCGCSWASYSIRCLSLVARVRCWPSWPFRPFLPQMLRAFGLGLLPSASHRSWSLPSAAQHVTSMLLSDLQTRLWYAPCAWPARLDSAIRSPCCAISSISVHSFLMPPLRNVLMSRYCLSRASGATTGPASSFTCTDGLLWLLMKRYNWRLSYACIVLRISLFSWEYGMGPPPPKRSSCMGARGGSIINRSVSRWALLIAEVGADNARMVPNLQGWPASDTIPSWMALNPFLEASASDGKWDGEGSWAMASVRQ